MIETLISSKTRLKLLLKFFLNSNNRSYLRSLEVEFNESTNAIRLELNRFEAAGLLQSIIVGNKKIFSANTHHPLFINIQQIVLKHVGIDTIIDTIIKELHFVEAVYLTGKLAHGLNEEIIRLEIIGNVEVDKMNSLVTKTEKLIKRKIQFNIHPIGSAFSIIDHKDNLLIWSK